MSAEARPSVTRPWIAPALLVVLVTLAYAPSLGAGFLRYDDDWLIEDNPVMRDASSEAPRAILVDLSRETRLVLGAEYLPVRDLVTWGLVRACGISATPLRIALLALYLAALLAWREWLLGLLGPGAAAEIAALAFALHPAHAESVAWLAGYKDVLALLFGGIALATYASSPLDARRRALVIACVVLACFSKAMSVVLPGLMLFSDAWTRRRPDRLALGGSLVCAALAAAMHAAIGARVGIYAAMPGGDRLSALATMAPVAFRYLLRVVLIEPACIVYDVPDRSIGDPVALAALAALLLALSIAAYAFGRGERRALLLLGLALVALAPVGQVLAPIQHRMADRYLLMALAAPCIALGLLLARIRDVRARVLAATAIASVLLATTALRASTLADPVALWAEASERAPASPLGPYQLAMTLEDARPDLAEAAFRESLARDGMTTETGRRAADNLAILLARRGHPDDAIALLEDARGRYPRDPRLAHNLAILLDARGDHARARELMLEVLREAPQYEAAWRSYRSRWGEPPLPQPAAPRYEAIEGGL